MSGDLPPPGSEEALDRGCTCPVMDNNHGRGRFGDGDEYAYDPDCELHGGAARRLAEMTGGAEGDFEYDGEVPDFNEQKVMGPGGGPDDTEWSVVLEWWTAGEFQHRVRARRAPGSTRWELQKQSRGPGGYYVEDWTRELQDAPEVHRLDAGGDG